MYHIDIKCNDEGKYVCLYFTSRSYKRIHDNTVLNKVVKYNLYSDDHLHSQLIKNYINSFDIYMYLIRIYRGLRIF